MFKLKKAMILLFSLALTLSVFMTGCEKDGDEVTKGAKEQEEDAIVVSSLEEFIDAIEPDANIVFKKGTYDFTPELDELYGDDGKSFNKKHDYVQILDCYDGVELVIQDVDGLKISGQDGKKVEIQVEPRYADVIRFEGCQNISISNMTIGHTEEQGSCCGDVLEFNDCEEISLDSLDLYGCGTYAVTGYESSGITVENSVLHDCSYGLVSFVNCDDVIFKSCDLTDTSGYTMLDINNSVVTFNKCTFDNNSCDYGFVTFNSGNSISFKACTFGAVESSNVNCGDIDADETGVTFDSKCTFDDSLPAVTGGITSVTIDGDIDTVGEILEAIDDNTEVQIQSGYYNLSEFIDTLDIDGYNACHDKVRIDEVYDGYEVVIQNCSELTITSATNDCSDVEIVTDPRYAAVFKIENSDLVLLGGLTLGHTETGECSGPVVYLDSSSASIFSCDLYGCGVYGIEAYNCGFTMVYFTTIRDCSYGPYCMTNLQDTVDFYECTLEGSSGVGYIEPSKYFTHFQNCTFGEYETYDVLNNPCVTYDNCEFADVVYYPENTYGGADEDYYTECTLNDYEDYLDDYYMDRGVYTFNAFYLDEGKETYLLPFYAEDYEEFVYVHMIIDEDCNGQIIGMTGKDIISFTFDEDDMGADVIECEVKVTDGYDYLDDNCQLKFYKEGDYTYIAKLTFMDMDIWFMAID